ncbi:transposase [Streptomyces sp. N2-109]|uniref:Transposase n=1 Tax=Streptomyces gossypii TaxID=2883101 RepID=A0ABT2JU73_9ACTN|nr:transposase [Streptomyces gossypii]MCT2590920.1 transposase [Streptomyces gossypii]
MIRNTTGQTAIHLELRWPSAWTRLAAHLDFATAAIKGPIVLVWDNLRTHLMPQMKDFIAANEDWLTVLHFPSYAPDLNPQEGIWSLVKRTIGNLAAANLDQLAAAVKRSLKKTQYRPHLIDGCLIGTGLTLTS